MRYEDGSGESAHNIRMRRMMRFVRSLIDERKTRGVTLDQIAELASRIAARDGHTLDLNGPAVGRFGGQGDWYVVEASDFQFMRLYYILRALDSSLADLERDRERDRDYHRRERRPSLRFLAYSPSTVARLRLQLHSVAR